MRPGALVRSVLRDGHVFVDVPDEADGEVGFPGEFGWVSEEPFPASCDGRFDVGNAGDGPFGVMEAAASLLELAGGAGALGFEVPEVAVLGGDAVVGLVDGGLVGAAEPASSGSSEERARAALDRVLGEAFDRILSAERAP
jgi:hypothetical protein